MKKFLTTILALIYLSASVGATIHWHYCMGKLISWGLTDRDGKNCSFCGMPKSNQANHCQIGKKGCCKDEHKHIKIDNDQNATESAHKLPVPPIDLLAVNLTPLPEDHVSAYAWVNPTTHAPPYLEKLPVFLRNRNVRI
jgi:N6-adenosine-specific RNA methylase IME4